MSIDDGCVRCGSGRAWILSPVRERGGIMAVEANGAGANFYRSGSYDARVCADCGHTRFWARDYEPRRASPTFSGCLECGGRNGWRITEPPDLIHETYAEPLKLHIVKKRLWHLSISDRTGTLEVEICTDCGASAWHLHHDTKHFALDYPIDLARAARPANACWRCHAPESRALVQDQHLGRSTPSPSLRALIDTDELFGTRSGRFELDVCLGCQRVDWYGVRLDQLREDPELGVRFVDGTLAPDGGPYR